MGKEPLEGVEQLRASVTMGEWRRVTESEVIGLAVQLLKEKGAVEVESSNDAYGRPRLYTTHGSKPGRYLVVPLSILGEQS
jgi:hypothetical protein